MRMDDEDLERPSIPIWFRLVVVLLAIIGAFTVVRWILGPVLVLVKLAALIAFIALVVVAARAFTKRR